MLSRSKARRIMRHSSLCMHEYGPASSFPRHFSDSKLRSHVQQLCPVRKALRRHVSSCTTSLLHIYTSSAPTSTPKKSQKKHPHSDRPQTLAQTTHNHSFMHPQCCPPHSVQTRTLATHNLHRLPPPTLPTQSNNKNSHTDDPQYAHTCSCCPLQPHTNAPTDDPQLVT